jgi:hypothetical protein
MEHIPRFVTAALFLHLSFWANSETHIHPIVEFPQSQARASEVIPTQVLQGTVRNA